MDEQQPSWRRALRICFAFEPMRHAWWELLVMRCGIAVVAWNTVNAPSRFITQPSPHGLAAWGLDFTWIGDAQFAHTLIPVLGVCLALYALGVLPVLTLLPPLIASIGHGTLGNSQGAIGHTTQIVTMTLLGAWLAAAWSTICGVRGRPLPNGFTPGQLGVDWARQTIMASYVVSAITKLIESGGNWLADTPYFGLQIAKGAGMDYYKNLVPPDNAAWLAQYLVDHPLLAQILVGAALPLEFFAFLGLLNRRSALFFGLALFAFHSSVTQVMGLGFAFHKALLAVLFVNPPYWAVQAAGWLKRRFARTQGAP